jgi:prefoldin beta subunit
MQELSRLEDDNAVFKLMGPIMVKQENVDAVMNVDNRLKYLHAELDRVEKEIKDAQEGAEKCQKVLAEVAGQFRKFQEEAQKKQAAATKKE